VVKVESSDVTKASPVKLRLEIDLRTSLWVLLVYIKNCITPINFIFLPMWLNIGLLAQHLGYFLKAFLVTLNMARIKIIYHSNYFLNWAQDFWNIGRFSKAILVTLNKVCL
jgi:hypothetical protein